MQHCSRPLADQYIGNNLEWGYISDMTTKYNMHYHHDEVRGATHALNTNGSEDKQALKRSAQKRDLLVPFFLRLQRQWRLASSEKEHSEKEIYCIPSFYVLYITLWHTESQYLS